MSKRLPLIIGIVLVLGVGVGVWLWLTAGQESTDDAQVAADGADERDVRVRLVDVFEGKRQLIVYNHMWFPDEKTSMGSFESSSKSSTVSPNPPAAFSTLTIVKSTFFRSMSEFRARSSARRPG